MCQGDLNPRMDVATDNHESTLDIFGSSQSSTK